jgi:hypothetical protein
LKFGKLEIHITGCDIVTGEDLGITFHAQEYPTARINLQNIETLMVEKFDFIQMEVLKVTGDHSLTLIGDDFEIEEDLLASSSLIGNIQDHPHFNKQAGVEGQPILSVGFIIDYGKEACIRSLRDILLNGRNRQYFHQLSM